MVDLIDRFHSCLTESNTDNNVGKITTEFTVHELRKVMIYLIEKYEDRPFLLEQFWQKKSDSCPLEESVYEQQVIAFRKFISNLDKR